MVDLLDDDTGDEEEPWELDDPTDPSHPDFDLSEATGYYDSQPSPRWLPLPRGLILLVTIVLIAVMLWPTCVLVLR